MNPFKFPQIPRFFSASPVVSRLITWFERPLLWLGLAAFVGLNLWAQMTIQQPIRAKAIGALLSPWATNLHLDLAQLYWRAGLSARTRQELAVAQAIPAATLKQNILGATTAPLALLQNWEAEPARVAADYLLWQRTLKEKPDYRDGYLVLATLAYRLGRISEAKTNLDKALLLDPNFAAGQQLQQLLSSN